MLNKLRQWLASALVLAWVVSSVVLTHSQVVPARLHDTFTTVTLVTFLLSLLVSAKRRRGTLWWLGLIGATAMSIIAFFSLLNVLPVPAWFVAYWIVGAVVIWMSQRISR